MAKSNGTKAVAEVTFVDSSAEVKRTLANLSKSALRASGTVIRKKLRERVKELGLVRSDKFKNYIASWAFVERTTGQPRLQVGFYSWQKLVEKKGREALSRASPHWIESGTQRHSIPKATTTKHLMLYKDNFYGFHVDHPGQQATHLLRDTVYDNIKEIRAAQEKYLAELNKTLEEAGAKVFAGEEDEAD